MKSKPIYVEIEMDTSMERLWEYTQNPELHAKWDLRFSEIHYKDKETPDAPQLFTYKTKVGSLFTVEGWGESKGTHHKKDGSRTSSLHFGTEQKISPIAEGKGYWQYVPNGETLTFLTQYDYKVRYGAIGRVFDVLFRPLMGWATALSFDVLRRWLHTGEPPSMQYRRFFLSALLSLTFFFIWCYQGLITKLIGLHPEEVALFSAISGIGGEMAQSAVRLIGIAEILFGLVWLLPFNKARLYIVQLVLLPILTISAGLASIETFMGPFNVISLNGALIALSIVGYLCQQNCPTARSCKRRRKA